MLARFADHVRSFVDVGTLRPLKVVADTANGMGGLVVPAVFDGLPFDLEILFPELDGTFPNHPADPIQPENQRDLQARVLATGADVGLAFDGDADRVFLVDEKAELLSGSLTTAIVADEMLKREPGGTVIHNLICSKAVPEVVREAGGTPVRTRVGHSFIKAVMAETGRRLRRRALRPLLLPRQLPGRLRPDRRPGRPRRALPVRARRSPSCARPTSATPPRARSTPRSPDPLAVIDAVAEHFAGAEQDRLDGLTVDLGDWWFNLRPSNTEPLLRLNLEAADADACTRRVAEVQAIMEQAGRDLGPA